MSKLGKPERFLIRFVEASTFFWAGAWMANGKVFEMCVLLCTAIVYSAFMGKIWGR